MKKYIYILLAVLSISAASRAATIDIGDVERYSVLKCYLLVGGVWTKKLDKLSEGTGPHSYIGGGNTWIWNSVGAGGGNSLVLEYYFVSNSQGGYTRVSLDGFDPAGAAVQASVMGVGDENARIYWSDGTGFALLETNSVRTAATIAGRSPSCVEVWPDRAALSAARLNRYRRDVSWYLLLYDADGNPQRDRAGNLRIQQVAPEWRRSSELYGGQQ